MIALWDVTSNRLEKGVPSSGDKVNVLVKLIINNVIWEKDGNNYRILATVHDSNGTKIDDDEDFQTEYKAIKVSKFKHKVVQLENRFNQTSDHN